MLHLSIEEGIAGERKVQEPSGLLLWSSRPLDLQILIEYLQNQFGERGKTRLPKGKRCICVLDPNWELIPKIRGLDGLRLYPSHSPWRPKELGESPHFS